MRHDPGWQSAAAHLLPLAGLFLISSPVGAWAQIFLNPSQQTMTRSRVSIDMGDGLRCSSDGGSVPTLGISIGAYPDQIGSNNILLDSGRNTTNQSSLLGLVSVFVPLDNTSQSFDCKVLLQDAQFKARLSNLRELLEEDLISESQYREAVQRLLAPLVDRGQAGSVIVNPPPRSGGTNITISDDPAPLNSSTTSSPAAPPTVPRFASFGLLPPPPLPPLPKEQTPPPEPLGQQGFRMAP